MLSDKYFNKEYIGFRELKIDEEMSRLSKSITFNAIKENVVGLFFREEVNIENMINNLEKLFNSI